MIQGRWRISVAVLALCLLGAACVGPEHTSAGFCTKLTEVTGAGGVESALEPGDPARIDGVVAELAELHERAPEEISTTTRALLVFFRSYQRAARDERRDVIAENELQLAQASFELDQYALDECGLLLERAVPTPRPTLNPVIQAPITD